jgi:hypothetical protein
MKVFMNLKQPMEQLPDIIEFIRKVEKLQLIQLQVSMLGPEVEKYIFKMN